jgi:hypothetical protein
MLHGLLQCCAVCWHGRQTLKAPCSYCTEIPIYVFPEMKLRDLVPNSYIYVSVIDLYIPRIGHRYMNVELGEGTL